MGRPEPCALFSHSFVHAQLDEYVDEVLFAGPVVVTGCEFLEQNASPSVPAVSLIGATSPPSFALEVFVHCEGESRFRRLCQPFLYSPSSSNVLEVEAVVTNHLVVRGTYRSLSLVIYGNTAEDLGQFNIDVDMDSSLANLIYSSSEGMIEDLPAPLRSRKLSLEDSISSLNTLSLPLPMPDLSNEMKEFLLLVFKIWQIPDLADALCRVLCTVISLVSSFLVSGFGVSTERIKTLQCASDVFSDARDELHKLCEGHLSSLESEKHKPTGNAGNEWLFYSFGQCFPYEKITDRGSSLMSQNQNIVFYLGVAIIFCSAKETCNRFVKSGGMEKVCNILSSDFQRSTGTALLLLCTIEQATRHSIGCEAFLGWWPRKGIDVPIDNSDSYCRLLSLLIQKKRHDVASLATYILHRLRFYEVSARYESEVLSLLMNLSDSRVLSLDAADSLLKSILKLLSIQVAVEDPSPAASAKSSAHGQQELLSYKETVDFISESKHSFSMGDIDPHMLSLLKERGFLPLSAALLSSPILRLGSGGMMEIFAEVVASIELILLRLLGCHSGLTFLLLQPEATATLISSLQGFEDSERADNVTLRHVTVLISKGFFCRPQDIGMIADVHLRVGSTIDRLLSSPPHSEEQLWTLWELCAISRSDYGRQALLSVGQFPEAVSVLIQILRSFKDVEPMGVHAGGSSSNLAIFHFAAEIIEFIVMDPNASSLASWIQHAVDLHGALHVSSPGLNKKDAPGRVLDWIDAGIVYNKNGVTGLLRYAAVLASGGDAHLSAASVLVSESTNVENVVGDSGGASDSLFVDNLLGKFVADKQFDGVALSNMSLVQLTTAFRILAFISENSTVATLLFDEGAVTLILVTLVNCRFILERSSNTFDYLVDEGTESGSTSDLLMEQNIEQRVTELMIPSLVLLINLLQKLQEAKEQYRNTKLLKALLRLHRELSPKLAPCEAEVSFHYRSSALSLCTVCRLLASAMACWPIFGWTPGLFHCLMESIQATPSSFSVGPRDACSFLCLLGDLFPEEGIWLWKDRMPSLSAIRILSLGTILGPKGEKCIEWHLQPEHLMVLLGRLTPQLSKIAQIVLHFCLTDLAVIRDMLRVLVIRISCQRPECAVILLEPVISWINDCTKVIISLSEADLFKTFRLLEFIASLLEHPFAKEFLLKMGILKILEQILGQCHRAFVLDENRVVEKKKCVQSSGNILRFCMLSFKSLTLLFDSRETESESCVYDEISSENTSMPDSSGIMPLVLNLCQALPVGRELLSCLLCLKVMISSVKGRSGFLSISLPIGSSETVKQVDQETGSNLHDNMDLRSSHPFLDCWRKLLRSMHGKNGDLTYAVECIHLLSLSSLCICRESENKDAAISKVKSLFGLPSDESVEDILKMSPFLDQNPEYYESMISSLTPKSLNQAKEAVTTLISLLQSPKSSSFEDYPALSMPTNYYAQVLRFSIDYDDTIRSSFFWECADAAPERLMMSSLTAKRKFTSAEGSVRRPRDTSTAEALTSNGYPRGLGPTSSSSGPSRRDTFRQRKPNTSRPPSMHVDDYVARERNADMAGSGTTGQRGGISSGRPPSIHVDEFMARQRERQSSSIQGIAGDTIAQGKNMPLMLDNDSEKADKSQKLKAVLDDDHEINIVFDDEPESEDKLMFPQPDDNLLPAPLAVGPSSPQPFMDGNEEGSIHAGLSNAGNLDFDDVNLRRRLSSQMEASTSEKRTFFQEQFSSVYGVNQSPYLADSQHSQAVLFPGKSSSSSSSSSAAPQVYQDNKLVMSQPPLPPTPPPALSPIPIPTGQAALQNYAGRDLQPPLPSGFPLLQGYEVNAPGSVSVPNYQPATSNSSARTIPPLPTPLPPFSSSHSTTKLSLSSNTGIFASSRGSLPAHSLPLFTPWQAPSVQSSSHSSQPRLAAPPPLPPPPPLASLRPSLPQPQSRSGVQFPQPPSVQVQLPQQLQIPHLLYYQSQQQEKFTGLPPQTSLERPQSSSDSRIQEQDPGISLQQYFSSPEAIESLLNDRDKLCQILEQHPKLVQMLQERLGQI